MTQIRTLCAVALAMGAGSITQAAITAGGGATNIIAPPPSTALGALESNTQARAFNEVTNFTLATNLPVNATTPGTYTSNGSLTPGIIPAGSVINSHYLYTDPVGGATAAYEGFVEFDATVIGIIVLRSDLNSSDFLGAPGTIYADNVARGLELSQAERFTLTLTGNRINYRFNTSTATDDIRVITLVPTPGALALLGVGGLVAMRRRRAG
jgi:hypothetical protein